MPGLDHFRAEQRHRVNLTAQISDPDSQQPTTCSLLDLGMGGARIRCVGSFATGNQVELTLTAPTLWEPLIMPVVVAWVRREPEGRVVMGLKFEPTSGMLLLILAELLRDHDRY